MCSTYPPLLRSSEQAARKLTEEGLVKNFPEKESFKLDMKSSKGFTQTAEEALDKQRSYLYLMAGKLIS